MPALSLSELRHRLHACAELSGEESRTAALLCQELEQLTPDRLVCELGGHGLVAIFDGPLPGPRVLLRADMDALPLPDRTDLAWAEPGGQVSHKCGHDGHMSLLLGVARQLAGTRPSRGSALLLFQPAEETGAGARAVLDDPRFRELAPDRVLAIHNLPGYPLGTLVSREGCFASASQGLSVRLTGVSSHAAEPERGRSPVACAAQLAQALAALAQAVTALHEAAQLTVVGREIGGPAFGTSPGSGRVCATLRTHDSAVMTRLARACEELGQGLAAAHGITCELEWVEIFPATWNNAAVVRSVERLAGQAGFVIQQPNTPFAWSEDFGHFTAACPGALFGLGAGENQPPLHHPDYDFPDTLLDTGVRFLLTTLKGLLEEDSP